MANPLYGRNVVSIKDFKKNELEYLFEQVDTNFDVSNRNDLHHHTLGLLFFEPSTRTRLSFESAITSLGGNSISLAETNLSSIEKGENLTDTIKTLEQYVNAIVIRHSMEGSAKFAAEISNIPIINAGSGTEEHPTQAMLDLYTIKKEKGTLDNLEIGILGDLKYSRTVYSLIYALSHYSSKIHLISPPSLSIRNDLLVELKDKISIREYDNVEEVLDELDILYVTRIQKERFPDMQEYQNVQGSYKVDSKLLEQSKDNLILMHPFPRTGEISSELDSTDKAKYFNQIKYGKLLRAELLRLVLTE